MALDATDATKRIIFVVGNSRSGTTMMGRILGRHPLVFTCEELHFFEQLWNPAQPNEPIDEKTAIRVVACLLAIQQDGYHARRQIYPRLDEASEVLANIAPPVTAPAAFAAFIDYEARRHGKSVGCDQTPRNLYYLPELLDIFPEAIAIVMIRDPRDVFLSQKNRWRRRALDSSRTPRWQAVRTWSGFHPVTTSLLWRGGIRAGDKMALHPRVTHVRFEDLVVDPELTVRHLCDKLGVDYEPQMLEVPRVGSSNVPDRADQRGIDAGMSGRWHHHLSATDIWTCQRINAGLMAAHGYETVSAKPDARSLALSALSLGGKTMLTLAMNFRRAGSLSEAARRRLG